MPTPHDPPRTRTDQAVAWVGWHLAEIAGVTVPLVLALTVTAWLAVVSVLVAGAWAAHEIRLHRRRRALTAAPTRPSVTTGPADTETLTRKDASA
jgi:hypothetical protein